MTEEHSNYFKTVYPKMFTKPGWGPFCNDGWFPLVSLLCQSIQSHCDWKPECPQVTIDQVKEKFGTLRFYYSGGDEYVNGLVSMAETMSGIICENCGVPGTTDTSQHWIKVLCDTCKEERMSRRREQDRELYELKERGKTKP